MATITTVITYSHQPYGESVDLCDYHASDDGDGDVERRATEIGVLMAVQHGEHSGQCAVCAWIAEGSSVIATEEV